MLKMFLAHGLEVGSLLIFCLLNCSSTSRDQDCLANRTSQAQPKWIPYRYANLPMALVPMLPNRVCERFSRQFPPHLRCRKSARTNSKEYMKEHAALRGLGEGKLHLCEAAAIRYSDVCGLFSF